jgi:hypothetical protein
LNKCTSECSINSLDPRRREVICRVIHPTRDNIFISVQDLIFKCHCLQLSHDRITLKYEVHPQLEREAVDPGLPTLLFILMFIYCAYKSITDNKNITLRTCRFFLVFCKVPRILVMYRVINYNVPFCGL